MDDLDLLGHTADIVTAHVANNTVAISDIPGLIASTYAALANLGGPPVAPVTAPPVPAVSIRASIKPDYLVDLEDGTRHKTLKRHLMSAHGLTPDEYRRKWGLPADYPMTAPNYSRQRAELARKIGLGKSRRK